MFSIYPKACLRTFTWAILTLAVCACGRRSPPRVANGGADTGLIVPTPSSTTQPPAAASAPSSPIADCPESEYTWSNIPRWAQRPFTDTAFNARYELFTRLNPFFLTGYFDSDDAQDLAVQIRERGSGRRGVAILHRGTGDILILGAGNSVGNGGEDWSWLWVWRVEDPDDGSDERRKGRQLLLVEKPESASGYLWWDGQAYQWTQGSD